MKEEGSGMKEEGSALDNRHFEQEIWGRKIGTAPIYRE